MEEKDALDKTYWDFIVNSDFYWNSSETFNVKKNKEINFCYIYVSKNSSNENKLEENK